MFVKILYNNISHVITVIELYYCIGECCLIICFMQEEVRHNVHSDDSSNSQAVSVYILLWASSSEPVKSLLSVHFSLALMTTFCGKVLFFRDPYYDFIVHMYRKLKKKWRIWWITGFRLKYSLAINTISIMHYVYNLKFRYVAF